MYGFSCLQTLNLDYNGALWFVKKKKEESIGSFSLQNIDRQTFYAREIRISPLF